MPFVLAFPVSKTDVPETGGAETDVPQTDDPETDGAETDNPETDDAETEIDVPDPEGVFLKHS